MKALMFGGAFNPPTRAHIELAEYVKNITGVDKIIFVPTKMTYIAEVQGKEYVFTNEDRLSMLKKIAQNHEWMIVSDYEIHSDTQPRTYQTLCYLKDCGYNVSLLFGSDKLTELETGWRNVDKICIEFGIYCMQRNHDNCKELIENDAYLKALSSYIHIVDTPDTFQSISSTKIRELLLAKKYEEAYAYLPEELHGLR